MYKFTSGEKFPQTLYLRILHEQLSPCHSLIDLLQLAKNAFIIYLYTFKVLLLRLRDCDLIS